MKEKKNNIFIVLAVPVVIFLILTACIDNYGFHSLKIVLSQAIIPTTLGYAMCFTNAIGMFDLSCASAMIIAAMIGGSLGNTMGIPGLIIGCIAVGVVLGVINGTVYKLLKIPCLIVSLGLLLIYEILAQKIGLGVSKTIPADVGIIGKFPYSLIILGASALLFYYIYNKTCIACHIRAVGNEELLANALGVNAMNTKYMTFVLAGIFIGITAILQHYHGFFPEEYLDDIPASYGRADCICNSGMVQSDAWCIHKPVHPFHDVQCIDCSGCPEQDAGCCAGCYAHNRNGYCAEQQAYQRIL